MKIKPLIPRVLTTLGATLLLCTARADITTGLVGYWTFDAGSGSTAADSSGNNNTGTLTQFLDTGYTSMWTTNSWSTNALLFNQNGETTNYVNVPNSTSLNAPSSAKQWTLAAWVKCSVAGASEPANAGIISKGLQGAEAYALYINGSGKFVGAQRNVGNTGGQTVSSSTVAAANTWYHVAVTFTTSGGANHLQMVMYINGATNTLGTANTYTTVYTTNLPVIIGSRANASDVVNLGFKGTLDDVRIYSRAMVGSDIFQLYTNNAPMPVITTQPRNVNCYANDTAVFGVAAATSARNLLPLSYQWQFNGTNIAGATAATLSVPNVSSEDLGTYAVVVTNYGGSVTSSPAILTMQSLPAVDTTSGLVGWWKMDDASGSSSAADSSGNNNPGALTNFLDTTFTSQWGPGINGGALTFNGDGDGSNVVVVPSIGAAAPAVLDFSASPVFSLAVWVKGSLIQSNDAALIAKGTGSGGEQYTLDAQGLNYRFFVRDTNGAVSQIQSTVPVNGFWQHLVGVVNATNATMNLYVNGVLAGSTVAPSSLLANTHEVSIGNRQAGTAGYNDPWTGAMDEVRFYSRDLTSADVASLFGQDAFPVITAQYPVTYTNLMTLYAGSSPTLSIASVTGLGLSYQWYTNGVADPSGTSATYQLSNLAVGGFTNYYCVVTNSKGSAMSTVWTAQVVPAPTAPYSQSVLGLNPVGYWRLDEADDTLNDGNPGAVLHDYVAGNDGLYTNTVLGQTGYAQGISNQFSYYPATDPESSAYFRAFATVDSYAGQVQGIDFGSPNGTTANFTVECWVNGAGGQGSAATILSKGIYSLNDAWSFSVDTTTARKYRFSARTAGGTVITATSAVAADSGVWHHLVGEVDETDGLVKFYLDGTNAATAAIGTTAGAYASAVNPMTIGSAQNNTRTGPYSLEYWGYINDVAAYGYALSDAQVQANYLAAGFPPLITQQPVSFTNVDEGTTLVVPANGGGGTPPRSLQWYDITFGSPGTVVPNQTNATLVISNISSALYNTHILALTVSNAYGQPQSSGVYISVQSGIPTVTVSPSSATVYTNESVVFSATAQGTEPFTYQWSVDGGPVLNATNASYTAVAASGNHTVSCAVTGPAGTGSGSATLTGLAYPSDSYAQGILADHPLAYWRLDEPLFSSVANDYAGGHNGGYNNATNGLPGFSPSDPDTAAGFGMNGVTNYSMVLEQDNSLAGIPLIDFSTEGSNVQFSVEAWVKAPAGQTGGIVAKGYGHAEQFNLDFNNNFFRFFGRDVSTATHGPTSTAQADGAWHHVVGVYDGSNGVVNLYVDSAVVGTSTMTPGLGLLPTPVLTSIGARTSSSTDTAYILQLSNAVVDEVALYGYALSSNQVVAHYTTAALRPQFTQDLPSQVYAYVGFPLSLAVRATSGTPLGYQWKRDGTNLVDSGAVSGSQTSTVTDGIAQYSDSGSTFQVLVTNQNGSVSSTVGTLTVLSRLTLNGFGNGWSSQGNPTTVPVYIGANDLRLLDGKGSESSSSYFSYPVYIGGFQATYTYQDVGGGGADGMAFVVQNDARGAAALGVGGGAFGYGGVTNSVAVEFDIYSNNGVGYAFRTNGATGKPYSSASPVNLASGDPIDVTVFYANGVLSLSLTDAVAQTSFTASTNIDIPGSVGGTTAYVGLSAGDGSVASTQTVSNFTFVSLPALSIQPAAGNQVNVTWPEAVGGFGLQQSPGLTPPGWSNVSMPATNVSGFNQVTLPLVPSGSYFRLINNP